jgi:hypothetical protein
LAAAVAGAELPRQPAKIPPLRRRYAGVLSMAATALLVISVLIWKWPFSYPGKSAAPGAKRVLAVVEIENMTQDPSLNWLRAGRLSSSPWKLIHAVLLPLSV